MRSTLRLVLLFALAACGRTERTEVWNAERAARATPHPPLVPGHVHLFEVLQRGTAAQPGPAFTARAERDSLTREVARATIALIDAKVKRGLLEERPERIQRVQYDVANWNKVSGTVKVAPDSQLVYGTRIQTRGPNRANESIETVTVAVVQLGNPAEVERTPALARAYWAEVRAKAERELKSPGVDTNIVGAAPSTTRITFAMLDPVQFRNRDPISPPSHPSRGENACLSCGASAALRNAVPIFNEGSVSLPWESMGTLEQLRAGLTVTTNVSVTGMDGVTQQLDTARGPLTLRLLQHCAVRIFEVNEDVISNGSGVIAVPRKIGVANWFEMEALECGIGDWKTTLTDQSARPRVLEELTMQVRNLRGELGYRYEQIDRVTRRK